jgi:hypothetical protein
MAMSPLLRRIQTKENKFFLTNTIFIRIMSLYNQGKRAVKKIGGLGENAKSF